MANDDGIADFAPRLNGLFERVPDENGRPYTNTAAVARLKARGINCSLSYMGMMRDGQKNNPSARLLNGIAELFGVPVSYFFDRELANRIDAEIDSLIAKRDDEIQGMMARMVGVSPSGKATVAALIAQVRKIEGLEDDDTDDTSEEGRADEA